MTLSRRHILHHAALSASVGALGSLALSLRAEAGSPPAAPVERMPVLFIGHGSPMNAISENGFTRALNQWGRRLPRPTAILVVSAHWLTDGVTGVTVNERPPTIHDFGGFPKALHEMQYPASGHPALARKTALQIRSGRAVATDAWGLDHGTWTVLHHLYPGAPVPVFQVSIDYSRDAAFHHAVGRELGALRELGVLIVGSGNVVHNLRATDRGTPEAATASRPWAWNFDAAVKKALDGGDTRALLAYERLDRDAQMAVPTPDHYWPFLYALGASGGRSAPTHVFEGFHSGTLSMRCLQWT
ncbi:MAG: 4,5-DOPA dioxygenase extradiol [Burkholderiaceae bacterium]